ncbi:protein RSI-1-like [Cynara cardunculus var. scolymus]|uniref:protein RSI-1-like n=1 Tax=Cynara cardunculus var. scolymus TaxID=59895 RepID=UPI000D626A06|nr:protein RSI-1-like [Cynara cardunculus var. scolymus]
MAGGRRGALILVLSLILLIAFADLVQGYRKLRPRECKGRCKIRCSATSHKKPCMFFCQKCCAKCLCVPPGVYGNKQKCGRCYNNWKTKEGKPKCP